MFLKNNKLSGQEFDIFFLHMHVFYLFIYINLRSVQKFLHCLLKFCHSKKLNN